MNPQPLEIGQVGDQCILPPQCPTIQELSGSELGDMAASYYVPCLIHDMKVCFAPLQVDGNPTMWELSGSELGDMASYYVPCLFRDMKVCLKFCTILLRHGIEHNLYSFVLVMLAVLLLLSLLPLLPLLPLLLSRPMGRGQGGNVCYVVEHI